MAKFPLVFGPSHAAVIPVVDDIEDVVLSDEVPEGTGVLVYADGVLYVSVDGEFEAVVAGDDA